MLVLFGESGSGKSTLERELEKRGLKRIISYTSREPRAGEVNGVNYHFITRDEFKKRLADGFFAQYIEYLGNYYGSAVEDCKDDTVIVVEPTGVKQLRNKEGIKVIAVYLDYSELTRYNRMMARDNNKDLVLKRIYGDRKVFKNAHELADYVVYDLDALSLADTVIEILRREGMFDV